MQSLIEKRIELVSQELPFDSRVKEQIRKLAVEFARSYLDRLEESEERFPTDVALSAIYISTNELGKAISQYEIAEISGFDLVRWPCVAADMSKRVNNKSSRSY